MTVRGSESEELNARFGDESCWTRWRRHGACIEVDEVLCSLVDSSQWCLEHECEEEKEDCSEEESHICGVDRRTTLAQCWYGCMSSCLENTMMSAPGFVGESIG